MFEIMNRKDRFHLYYLIEGDIREEKFCGLSHVAEHTLLIQRDPASQLCGKGYTYFNHVCLLFSCSTLDSLQRIDEVISGGRNITSENVRFAKCQVIQEIQKLQWNVRRSQQVISFLTDNRICRLPMGKIEDIESINEEEIKEWLCTKRNNGQIYRFIFKNAHEMLYSTPIPSFDIGQRIVDQNDMFQLGQDEFLRLEANGQPATINLYFRIPAIYSKDILVAKALFEYGIQQELKKHLGNEVNIFDLYFGERERFSVLSTPLNDIYSLENTLNGVRLAIDKISFRGVDLYKDKFMPLITNILAEEKSNFDVINATKNWILYKTPIIQKEDIGYIKSLDFKYLTAKPIARMPLKIIIR